MSKAIQRLGELGYGLNLCGGSFQITPCASKPLLVLCLWKILLQNLAFKTWFKQPRKSYIISVSNINTVNFSISIALWFKIPNLDKFSYKNYEAAQGLGRINVTLGPSEKPLPLTRGSHTVLWTFTTTWQQETLPVLKKHLFAIRSYKIKTGKNFSDRMAVKTEQKLVYVLAMWGTLSVSVKWCHWINKTVVRKPGGRKAFQQLTSAAGIECRGRGSVTQCGAGSCAASWKVVSEGCVRQSSHTRHFFSQLPHDPQELLSAQVQATIFSGKVACCQILSPG